MIKYDLAISFAGEDRRIADRIARDLDAAGYSIFYDRFAQADLWGADLSVVFHDVFAEEARFCLIFVSRHYINKSWPNLERQNAISRFIRERSGYLLCVRVDDARLPGLPSTVGYLDLRTIGTSALFNIILQKLGSPSHAGRISRLSVSDREMAKQVIEVCYTRAIFTTMHAEISMTAMYRSIESTLAKLQQIIPKIADPALQRDALLVLNSLDRVDRTQTTVGDVWALSLPDDQREQIDQLKHEVVQILLHIRRTAVLPIQMPSDLITSHFYNDSHLAGQPPEW